MADRRFWIQPWVLYPLVFLFSNHYRNWLFVLVSSDDNSVTRASCGKS